MRPFLVGFGGYVVSMRTSSDFVETIKLVVIK